MTPVARSGFPKAPLFGNPSQQLTKTVGIPAPQSGINAVSGLAEMGPQESILQYNLIPAQYGARVRTGYQQYASNVGVGGVKTIIPFSSGDSSQDKLFATAKDGIYDISTSGHPFGANLVFATADSTSGYGAWVNFVTTAGHFALYCDETNGYHVYNPGTLLWAAITMGGGATQISGVDPATLVYAMIFKSRIWFIEKNTANAWYLSAGTIYGAATKFSFGNKFRHGGTLVQLINWTVDGGEGVDDYLIAISSNGDIVVYKGNDPSSASDFVQHGSWFIGTPPAGRRIAGSFGGEVYVLSTYGLLPMSKLISGTLVQQNDIFLTKKITPLINEQMLTYRTTLGWEVKLIPSEQLLMIAVPITSPGFEIQFVQSLNTEGWSTYKALPYFTGEVWKGKFYFSNANGDVHIHTGYADFLSTTGTGGLDIDWSVLQTFQEFGEVGQYKKVQFVRPVFLAGTPISYSTEVKVDYDLTPLQTPLPIASGTTGYWDLGTWDSSTWWGANAQIDDLRSASGIGRALAIGISGKSNQKTTLIRTDLMFETGWAI